MLLTGQSLSTEPSPTSKIHVVPRHLGIIMDGNGRWATARGLDRTQGHREGLETAKKIVKAAAELGVKYLTLYTFSTENWKRAKKEVSFLMNLLKRNLRKEFDFYRENGIRVQHQGNFHGLPKEIQREISDVIEDTKNFETLTVILAINYGGRDEILRAAQSLAQGYIDGNPLDEAALEKCLGIDEAGDVDLIIRTGGEKRLSNFMLWQSAYAELIFSDVLWPDFKEEQLHAAIGEFQKRSRKFGAEQ